MGFSRIRTFPFQNVSSGNIYDVKLLRHENGSVNGVGRRRGTNVVTSDPAYDNTEVTFVVRTANLADAFGLSAKTNSYLMQAQIFNASNPAGAGAALSTLLT